MLFPFLDLTKKEKKLARLKTQKGGLGKIREKKKKEKKRKQKGVGWKPEKVIYAKGEKKRKREWKSLLGWKPERAT